MTLAYTVKIDLIVRSTNGVGEKNDDSLLKTYEIIFVRFMV